MSFLTLLLVTYGLIVLLNLWVYLILFFQDCSTPKTDCSSWIVLSLASLFWPVVLPLSSGLTHVHYIKPIWYLFLKYKSFPEAVVSNKRKYKGSGERKIIRN